MNTTSLPLSPRMRELCQFIHTYSAVHGYPPSMADAGEVLGITRNVALRYAREAAARGVLTFDHRTARSWRVVDLAAIGAAAPESRTAKGRRRS
jgi:hypothetical protein